MNHTSLISIAGLALVAWLVTGGGTSDRARRKTPRSSLTRQTESSRVIERQIAERVNSIRKERGLTPLRVNARLAKVARDYSRRMAAERFFEHEDAAGQDAVDRVSAVGIRFRILGENLCECRGAADPASEAVRGWMRSPSHRKNILLRGVTETGIGAWRVGDAYYVTQLFLRPVTEEPTPAGA